MYPFGKINYAKWCRDMPYPYVPPEELPEYLLEWEKLDVLAAKYLKYPSVHQQLRWGLGSTGKPMRQVLHEMGWHELGWNRDGVKRLHAAWYLHSLFTGHPTWTRAHDPLRRCWWRILIGAVVSFGPGPLPYVVFGEQAWEVSHLYAWAIIGQEAMVLVRWAGWQGPLRFQWVPLECLVPYCGWALAQLMRRTSWEPAFKLTTAAARSYLSEKGYLLEDYLTCVKEMVCWPLATGQGLLGCHPRAPWESVSVPVSPKDAAYHEIRGGNGLEKVALEGSLESLGRSWAYLERTNESR